MKNYFKYKNNALLLLGGLIVSSYTFGQVGINTQSPQTTLDVRSKNHTGTIPGAVIGSDGILVPRVSSLGVVNGTVNGQLVYLVGDSGVFTKGFYYWNGNEWRQINNSTSAAGSIAAIACSDVTLTPTTYTAGVDYSGIMTVPYSGGNGGTYTAQTIGPVNGLTATLETGSFTSGSGTLNYSVTGTPTVTSPTPTTFNLSIGGQTCNIIVGNNNTIKFLQFSKNSIFPIDGNTPDSSITSIGDISFRMNATSQGNNGDLFELRLNGGSDHITVWREKAGSGGTGFDNWRKYNSVEADTWIKLDSGINIQNNDSIKFLISLLNKRQIYRVHVVMNSDITALPTTTSGVTIFVEKLD